MPGKTSTVYYSWIMLLQSMFTGINHLTTELKTMVSVGNCFFLKNNEFWASSYVIAFQKRHISTEVQGYINFVFSEKYSKTLQRHCCILYKNLHGERSFKHIGISVAITWAIKSLKVVAINYLRLPKKLALSTKFFGIINDWSTKESKYEH